MPSRHEVFNIEHERTSKATPNPLALSLENTGVHGNHQNFISEEDKNLPIWSTRHANGNLVKASCKWKPVENDLKKVPNDGRFYRTGETGARQSVKTLMSTKLHGMPLFSDKENVESRSTQTRLGLSLLKQKASIAQHKSSAGLFGLTNVKRFQEQPDKPLSLREMNVPDEGGGRLGVSIDRISADYGGGLVAAFVEGSQSSHLTRIHFEHPMEGTGCSEPDYNKNLIEQPLTVLAQERPHETSWGALSSTASLKAPAFSIGSMKAPLLSEYEGQRSENEILCDWLGPADPNFFSQLHTPCEKPRPCSETNHVMEIKSEEKSPFEVPDCSIPSHSQHNPNADHVVVFFSVQKFLEDNASRVNRQNLSNLASLCSLYSHKVMCWVTKLCTEQNIMTYMRRIRQIFSPSARGFTRLDSQKLPEFSPRRSSHSSRKVLAKDNELRAVLLKINDVLASMETSSSENTQCNSRSGATLSSHESRR